MSEDSLRQVVERNRERWRRRQRTRKGGWDRFLITAANPRQAHGYELQMEYREREGRPPAGTNWRVVSDPVGKRIGSGLATLHALVQSGRRRPGEKTLVLHCGGSSVRMPHCSAFGKVFAPLPVEMAPGWHSTIFDENVALLDGLAERAEEGVVTAAGDVLIAFDPLAVELTPKSVVAVTVSVPVERGEGHGVFVAERPNGRVRRILQKYPMARLREGGAVDPRGSVLIDTGIFFLPPPLVLILVAEVKRTGSPLREALKVGGEMDLYTDFSEALAGETSREDYLQAAGDDLRRRMRRRLWELLHDRFPLHIAYLAPGAFFHLGSTADYLRGLRPETEVGKVFGFERRIASPAIPGGGGATLISCSVAGAKARGKVGRGALLENCVLWGEFRVGRDSLASGLGGAGSPIRLRSGIAAFSAPLTFPNDFRIAALAGREAWATAVYGIDDNPKASAAGAGATFMNQPLLRWLAARFIAPEDVWPEGLSHSDRRLWTARLFPAEVGARSTEWLEWFQTPAHRARLRRDQWGAQPRLSLAEVFEMADCEKLANRRKTNPPIPSPPDGTLREISEVLRKGEDTNIEALYGDFGTPAEFLQLKSTLDHLVLSLPCAIRRARVFKVAADMMADERFAEAQQKQRRGPAGGGPIATLDEKAMLRLWGHAYEELSFANVRLAIEACVPTPGRVTTRRLLPGISLRVEVPARIDLGGGWSDTPPYSLEKGGAVVNFALTLDGQCPVAAWGKTLPQPVLRLGSLDLGVTQEIADLEHMGTYDDVEDPLALLKAAAVFEGIVPKGASGPVKAHMQRLGAGVELITECRLPKGSGMGTSSILAAAAVAALAGLRGSHLSVKELFNHVLCVEQMMTTGGGWQDQVGGAVGGIKYIQTTATAPFNPRIEKIRLPAAALRDFNERLVVYYTGHNRLAKNILRQIMGDYLSRRQPVFQTLQDIRGTADQLREAFRSHDLDAVGRRMSQSWELNKRLNPTTSNERIDALFAVAAPYIAGGKLAGAGGGGFMALLTKDRASAEQLKKILRGLAMGTEQRLHDAAVDMTGIRVRAE